MIWATLLLLDVTATLTPMSPSAEAGNLRWSPKGAVIELKAVDGALIGEFHLGAKGTKPIKVQLSKSENSEHFDRLWLDIDRSGGFDLKEIFVTQPTQRNGNWWSSFTTPDLPIPLAGKGSRAYPITFWFVVDPTAENAKPTLRWSRRGWHEGKTTIDGKDAYVLITEMVMDGVFDQRDAWFIARDRKGLLGSMSRDLQDHVWLDGKAYRLTHLDPDGLKLEFQPFDPGITEEDEKQKRDLYLDDKAAARAAKPVAFSHSYEDAVKAAAEQKQNLLVDFETTWCGPCKQMDELVYSSQAVVNAASGITCVKVDGDQRKDLTKRLNVGAYPTMILFDSKGKELKRVVGYQSVKAMTEFLKR